MVAPNKGSLVVLSVIVPLTRVCAKLIIVDKKNKIRLIEVSFFNVKKSADKILSALKNKRISL